MWSNHRQEGLLQLTIILQYFIYIQTGYGNNSSEVESNYSAVMKMPTSLNFECTLKKESKLIENEMETGQNN